MRTMYIEGETFETAYVPLNEMGRPGIPYNIKFMTVRDTLEEPLRRKEDIMWNKKVEEFKAKGQNSSRGLQYGVVPNHLTPPLIKFNEIVIPASTITYSRVELARSVNRKDIPNVLAFSEILRGSNGYLFVERGDQVAYHGGTSQLHAIVGGQYPRNLPPMHPEEMTVEKWLEEQQKTEHAIEPEEVFNRQFLGIVLDRTLGYKPDIIMTAETKVNKNDLLKRFPVDAFERKGIIEFPCTPEELIKVILEHRELKRHVPPGFGGSIIELARIGGIGALSLLNTEGRYRGTPLIEYDVR